MDLEKSLLYRDALMLVLNKPAGIPVHKGKGGGKTLEDFFDSLRFGLPRPPSLAHRLDKDTSGCLVLGRHRQALITLGKLFEQGKVKKTYWAVVHGAPGEPEGRIELPLRKQSTRSDQWRMEPHPKGQDSITLYKVLGQAEGTSWLELSPLTGRTHQLRVHCAAIGCPILGDYIYGRQDGMKLHLHARAVTVPLYPKKDPIHVEAPPPSHMQEALAQFE